MTDDPGRSLSAGYDLPAPARAQVERLAAKLGLDLSEELSVTLTEALGASLAGLRSLRRLEPTTPGTSYPRLPGKPPHATENVDNAWSWRCEVVGADSGPIHGKTIAVKESVAIAGVPMSNGSALLEGHVASFDATVVTRLLDAGGIVSGRGTTENLGLSSGSNTSVTGAVSSPRRPGYAVGGSSSGVAALVANGSVDLGVGTDQGGSVRNPAALCGIYGFKPSFGAVPYTGILSIEGSLDHVGYLSCELPLIRSAYDATAGADGLDPRQGAIWAAGSRLSPDSRLGGLRCGVLDEGLAMVTDGGQVETRSAEITAALRDAGFEVEVVSIPEHLDGNLTATPIYAQGISSQLFEAGGTALGSKGFFPEVELATLYQALHSAPNLLPDTGKLFALLGAYLREQHSGRYYSRAQNAGLTMRALYSEALAEYDVLLMPACAPYAVAQPLPESPGPADVLQSAFGYHLNTAIFNVTGHPGVSLPAGTVDGLPFGILVTGQLYDDHALLEAAARIDIVLRDLYGKVVAQGNGSDAEP